MIHIYETLSSTQDEAKKLAEQGAKEGTVVVAKEQTKGRGRHGKTWFSPKGKGIWMSQILYPNLAPHLLIDLPIIMTHAVKKALDPYFSKEQLTIKWPNDLLVHGKKISGVLVETTHAYTIVGIGISLDIEEEEFPDDLKNLATSVCATHQSPYKAYKILTDLLRFMEEAYYNFLRERRK